MRRYRDGPESPMTQLRTILMNSQILMTSTEYMQLLQGDYQEGGYHDFWFFLAVLLQVVPNRLPRRESGHGSGNHEMGDEGIFLCRSGFHGQVTTL